jgi:RNA polymerase sigma-70 factor (ECF subfamily)
MARTTDEQGLGVETCRLDLASFAGVVERYSADVAQLANRMLGWPGDVDDVVQEVFLAAYLNLKGFRGQCLVRTWLFTITINKCRSHQRRQRLHLKALFRMAEQPLVQAGVGQDDEVLQKVRLALDRLPSRYREPVVLWYLQELQAEQICTVLGINRNTLHVRLTRARQRLRDLLSDIEDEL